MKNYFTLLLVSALLLNTVPLAFAEDGTTDDDDEETLVEGESCEDESGFVFDVAGEGLVCVEIGTAVPDTDCILTDDMDCEEIGDDDDEETLADLTVSNLTFTESTLSEGSYYVKVDYANLNSVDVDTRSGHNLATLNETDSHSAYSWSTLSSSNVEFLDADGESLQVLAFPSPKVLTAGDEVEVCVDAYDVVEESDEDNNCVSEEFSGADGDDDDDDEVGDDDDDDDDDDDVEDALEDIFENEGEEEKGLDGGTTVASEEVDNDEFSDDMNEALEAAKESGNYPDKFYLLVQWGYFPEMGEEVELREETVWDGTVTFGSNEGESVVARPYKTVGFEKDEDSIDFDSTTEYETAFESSIWGLNDGILFKVGADLSSGDTEVSFETDYDSDTDASVDLADLLEDGSATFDFGDYEVHMTAFDHDDWLESHSEHRGQGHMEQPKDAEQGAWYENYMNYSVDNGYFNGYKDDKGELNGKIGPGDNLTRFQLLKVMYELSGKLEMGVATSGCDPDSVTQTDDTDWMGDHWARGYVQCIEDSDGDLTVLNDVVAESLEMGEEAALRWEVVVTAFEMLEVDASDVSESDLSDLSDSGLEGAFQDMIAMADELGIVAGYSDGEFKPEKPVNRAEMFKIVSLFSEVFAL